MIDSSNDPYSWISLLGLAGYSCNVTFPSTACIICILYRLVCGFVHSRISDLERTFLERNFLLCHGAFGEDPLIEWHQLIEARPTWCGDQQCLSWMEFKRCGMGWRDDAGILHDFWNNRQTNIFLCVHDVGTCLGELSDQDRQNHSCWNIFRKELRRKCSVE